MLLQVIFESERPTIRCAAHTAAILEIVVLLVRLDVRSGGVERRKRSRALSTPEWLRVTILMAGKLHPRLERLRTVRARIGARVTVRQNVMIVDGRGLETLTAMLASIGSHARVRAHMQSQTVGHAKCFATNLPADRNSICFLFSFILFLSFFHTTEIVDGRKAFMNVMTLRVHILHR